MILLVLLLVVTTAPVVWIVAMLSSIRRNTARTVELLERAEMRVPSPPMPWTPDPEKWDNVVGSGRRGDEAS